MPGHARRVCRARLCMCVCVVMENAPFKPLCRYCVWRLRSRLYACGWHAIRESSGILAIRESCGILAIRERSGILGSSGPGEPPGTPSKHAQRLTFCVHIHRVWWADKLVIGLACRQRLYVCMQSDE